MNDFIAIDVETANSEPSSICSIGAVKVVDGIIIDSRYSLISPEPNFFSASNVRIHGIKSDDTAGAHSFGTLWNEWAEWMAGFRLVAHNAAFDGRCIHAACRCYRIEPPENIECTLSAARKHVPRGMCASKSLDSLCEFFGIPLVGHHNALADAEACAKLAIILL